MKIMFGIAFAEDQPVAKTSFGDTLLEQGTQTGDARSIADQDDRHIGNRRMEGRIAAHAGVDFSTG